jgi:uncharacterized protein YbaR (Trm112 family)
MTTDQDTAFARNDAPDAEVAQSAKFDRRMIEALVCPLTQVALSYDAQNQELISKAARLAFPIRDGIPIMLIDEARKL